MSYDNIERIDSITAEAERDRRDEERHAALDNCYTDFVMACRRGNPDKLGLGIECLTGGVERMHALICDMAFSATPAPELATRARTLIDAAAGAYTEFAGAV